MTENLRYQAIKKVTIVGMIINSILAIVKIIVGLIGRSPALFADGIHSLSDLISDLFVLFAARYSSKEVDHNHPYGHQRIETIATVALSLILIAAGFGIAYDAISHLLADTVTQPDNYTIIAAVFSILANEWLFRYTLKTANKIDSDMLRANAWHSRSDALSSVVVLIGLLGSMIGYPFMDAIAAIIVCLMIIKMGVTWGYQAISELIDTGAEPETIEEISKIIQSAEGVLDFHNLRTRKMAGQLFLDVHILIASNLSASEGHYIGERVRATLSEKVENIKDITVHIDVDNHPEGTLKLADLPLSRKELLNSVAPILEKEGLDKFLHATQIYYDGKNITIVFCFDLSTLEVKSPEQIKLSMSKIRKACPKITQTEVSFH